MIIASGSGTGFGRWRAARHAAALEDLDDDIWPPQQGHNGRQSAAARSAMVVSRAVAGSVSGCGAAISSLARAILALQVALASSP